jgi:predicted N-acetyltransferase YhbS
MTLLLRQARPEDAKACGRILYDAFKAVAEYHNFPPDFPSVDVATSRASKVLAHPGFYALVAEEEGVIVGTGFMDERSIIAGIGPVAVDPKTMSRSIGREVMRALMDRAADRRSAGVRLVQMAYNYSSLSLYTKLGFDAREPLSVLQGKALGLSIAGHEVRKATQADLPVCHGLCRAVHGYDRDGELHDAIEQGTANVTEHLGQITGYATGIGWTHHAVAKTNDDLRALIGAAPMFLGPGFFVPTRNGDLLRWCFSKGLRLVAQGTLMTIGLYNEPAGPYLPSVLS